MFAACITLTLDPADNVRSMKQMANEKTKNALSFMDGYVPRHESGVIKMGHFGKIF